MKEQTRRQGIAQGGSASPEDDGKSNCRRREYQAAKPHLLCERVEDNAFHLIFQQREEFGTRPRVVFENAEQTRCFHDRVLFFNSSHHHTKMLCLHHYSHPGRLKTLHQ
jgi:hypothetical protein